VEVEDGVSHLARLQLLAAARRGDTMKTTMGKRRRRRRRRMGAMGVKRQVERTL